MMTNARRFTFVMTVFLDVATNLELRSGLANCAQCGRLPAATIELTAN
jgi:hypothetical protein